MSALIKGVTQDMANSCAAPRIVVDIAGGISFYSGDENLVLHQLLGNPHTAPAIQCQVIDFANHRRSLRVKDQMPPILWVTHQPQGRLSATELSLSGTGHTPRQHFLGNIPAIHIVQDILEGRDVHFLTGQTVHAIRNGDIADIVFGEEDFNIAAGFDIISSQSGQVFGNDTANFAGLNIGNHPLKSRTIEISACVTIVHIILILEHPVFLGKFLEHKFLIADTHTLVIAAIVQRNTAIEGCNFLIDLFFPAHSNLLL